jgi:HSP20 family protein
MNLLSRKESNGPTALQRQLSRLFEDFSTEFSPERFGAIAQGYWAPALDLVETPETLIVKLEVPGVDPKDIEISVSGDALNVQGEKREEKEEKGRTFHRVERTYGAFRRSITLPQPVKADRVEAESKDGILTITLPKTPEAMPKRISVKPR